MLALGILLFHCINNLVVYYESTLERHFVWAEASGAPSLKRAQFIQEKNKQDQRTGPKYVFFFQKKEKNKKETQKRKSKE